MTPTRQLPLPFSHEPGFLDADFLRFASNQAACRWLAPDADWPRGQLALFGEPGCGKTHLLHIWARRRGAARLHGPMLAGLPDLSAGRAIALDDADRAGDEIALLHLLNAAAEARLDLLIAGRNPPSRWPVRLPDLASRLRAIPAIGIDPAEDGLLAALLARLLSDRQLAVPRPVQSHLLKRLPRTHAALAEAARRLDIAGLALGGRVTQRVADQVIADIADEIAGEAPATTASRDGIAPMGLQ